MTKTKSDRRLVWSMRKDRWRMSRKTAAEVEKWLITHRSTSPSDDFSRAAHLTAWRFIVTDKAVEAVQSTAVFAPASKSADFAAHCFWAMIMHPRSLLYVGFQLKPHLNFIYQVQSLCTVSGYNDSVVVIRILNIINRKSQIWLYYHLLFFLV